MTNESRAKKIRKLRGQHAAVLKHAKAIAEEIKVLVDNCLHEDCSRDSDPSGGRDHAYTCKVCGKEW